MYQVMIHEYGNDTPKGITIKTTPQLEEFLHTLEMKSLVYIEIRYVRSFRLFQVAKHVPSSHTKTG